MADPTTVPDLRLWLKADAGVTSTGGSPNSVTAWANSAPGFTAETVTQTTAAKQPVLTPSALNGLPAVTFDGTDDSLILTDVLLDLFRNLGGATVFAVARHDDPTTTSTTANQALNVLHVSRGGSNLARVTVAPMASSAAAERSSLRGGGRRLDADGFSSVTTANDSWPRATWRIATAEFAWSTSDLRLYLDGTLSAETLTFQTDGLTSDTRSLAGSVGANSANTGEYLFGPMTELLVYRRSLLAAERAEVHTYLSQRTAIAVSDMLPAPLTTYRPTSTITAGGWATTAASLHAALSDQSNTTAITGTGA